jgi:hypothetical protein
MIQLQKLHLCIFSAKWEEKLKRRKKTKNTRKTQATAAPRNLARGVRGAESVEGRKDNACHLIIRT